MYRGYDRLLSFASVHHAIRAEKMLLATGIRAIFVPTPSEIDISCGQSLLFKAKDETSVLKALQDNEVQWNKLFMRNIKERIYEELLRD